MILSVIVLALLFYTDIVLTIVLIVRIRRERKEKLLQTRQRNLDIAMNELNEAIDSQMTEIGKCLMPAIVDAVAGLTEIAKNSQESQDYTRTINYYHQHAAETEGDCMAVCAWPGEGVTE